jgi:hypothetical protein
MQPVHTKHGDHNKDGIRSMFQRLFPELHGSSQDKSNCGRGNSLERRGRERMVAVLVIDHAYGEHEESARQANADNAGQRASEPAQTVSCKDGHIGGVQPRQRLTDGEQLYEAFIVEPRALVYQAIAEIGDHTAPKTGGADD